jgi:hypothetical protein
VVAGDVAVTLSVVVLSPAGAVVSAFEVTGTPAGWRDPSLHPVVAGRSNAMQDPAQFRQLLRVRHDDDDTVL